MGIKYIHTTYNYYYASIYVRIVISIGVANERSGTFFHAA